MRGGLGAHPIMIFQPVDCYRPQKPWHTDCRECLGLQSAPLRVSFGHGDVVDEGIGLGAMAVAKVKLTAPAAWDMHWFIFTAASIDTALGHNS